MRDSGVSGSHRLKVRDHVDAWALDLAITHRLFLYDAEKWRYHRKAQAIDVMKAYAGQDLNWEEE